MQENPSSAILFEFLDSECVLDAEVCLTLQGNEDAALLRTLVSVFLLSKPSEWF